MIPFYVGKIAALKLQPSNSVGNIITRWSVVDIFEFDSRSDDSIHISRMPNAFVPLSNIINAELLSIDSTVVREFDVRNKTEIWTAI